ncbi:MAG: TIR domain-containing protein [Pseudomonadota bacterium]|nr:TIR domain-containing protein [Pseudomonadota bacterium]
MAEQYKYWAFISYSHQDRAWGDWLHKTLETYRVPSRLVGQPSRDGQVPARLFPIFRDRDELPSSANLGDALNESLRDSRYQIVICSPRAAASKWVNEEIKYFKSLGREDRVLCLIVDGEPNVFDLPGRDIEECFAPAIRYRVDRNGQITNEIAEPIAADAREHADGKRGAKLKLLSGLLGVGYDELVQRERQRQFWQRLQQTALAAFIVGVFVGGWQWFTAQRAAREHEIVVEQLTENGRLELLAGHQARAAVYLNEAYKRGNDSVPLRFMLAQAMKPVEALTNVRVKHGGVAVHKSAFSPDGKQFVLHVLIDGTSNQKAVAKLYDTATGAEIATLADAPPQPLTIKFMNGSTHLLMTGFPHDNRIGQPQTWIWQLNTPDKPVRIDGINGLAGLAVNADDSSLLIATDRGLEIRDPLTGRLLRTLLQGQPIEAASYSADGQQIAVGRGGGVVQILSNSDGHIVETLRDPSGFRVGALMFTPQMNRLIALSGREDEALMQGDIRVWDLETAELRIAFAADPAYLNELQFDSKGQTYLTVGSEGYKVWSAGRGSLLFSVPRALTPYASAALSPDGRTLVTADFENKTAEAWDVSAKRLLYTFDLHSDGISQATFDPQGEHILIASRDGAAELWRRPAMPLWQLESFETLPFSIRFSGDGEHLYVGGGSVSGQVQVYDVSRRERLRSYAGHDGVIFDLALSPDEKVLATASLDGTAGLWNLGTGESIARVSHNPLGTFRTVFNAAADRLLTTTHYETFSDTDAVGLWDAENGENIAWLRHSGTVYAAHFDADGKRVATAGVDGRVRIWDAGDGELLLSLPDFGARARSVRFSVDGQKLLTTAHDGSVRLHDARSGNTLHELRDPALGLPEDAVFSPDGKIVAIATQSGNIWLWSPTLDRKHILKGHQQSVERMLFTADGTLLFSDSRDGTVRTWATVNGRELGVLMGFERGVDGMDINLVTQRLAASAWGSFAIADIATESRNPDAVQVILNCKASWALDPSNLALIPQQQSTHRCN